MMVNTFILLVSAGLSANMIFLMLIAYGLKSTGWTFDIKPVKKFYFLNPDPASMELSMKAYKTAEDMLEDEVSVILEGQGYSEEIFNRLSDADKAAFLKQPMTSSEFDEYIKKGTL